MYVHVCMPICDCFEKWCACPVVSVSVIGILQVVFSVISLTVMNYPKKRL